MPQVQVFSNGSVYSPADPFATALVAHDEKIEWVGSDAGADSILDESMQSHNLDGLLITPGFVAGGVFLDSAQELQTLITDLPAEGYVAATVFIDNHLLDDVVRVQELSLFPYVRVQDGIAVNQLHGCQAYGVLVNPQASDASSVVADAIDAGLKVAFEAGDSASIEAALTIIEDINSESPLKRLRAGFRLDGVQVISQQQLEKAEKLNISIGFIDALDTTDLSLASAIKAGVSTYIGSTIAPAEKLWGWKLTTLAVKRSETSANISARAAFNSQTRGAWRTLGFAEPTQGQLVPGGNADFAVWHFDSLMVQTADERVAAWSTDPRARTPLLPALDGDTYPRCATTYHASQPIFSEQINQHHP